MEKQKLPNSTLILIFGIISVVCCCCCYGFLGLIFGVITLVMARTATKTYLENPELYTQYDNVKTGKILAIVGTILSLAFLMYLVFMLTTIGFSGIQEMQQKLLERYIK